MQWIFATKQAQELILALISLVSLSSLFIFATGPSYAATPNQKLISAGKHGQRKSNC